MHITISLNTRVESFDDYAEYMRVLKPFFELGDVTLKRRPNETLMTGGARAEVNELFEGRQLLLELMQVLHVIPNVTMELKRVEAFAVGEPATANVEYDGANMELVQQTAEVFMQYSGFVITLRSAERKPAIMPVAEPVAVEAAGEAIITIDGVAVTKLQLEGLNAKVADLGLSVRLFNCLKNDNYVHLGELCEKTEVEVLRIPNLGNESLRELKEVMESYELRFRTRIQDGSEVRVKHYGAPMWAKE